MGDFLATEVGMNVNISAVGRAGVALVHRLSFRGDAILGAKFHVFVGDAGADMTSVVLFRALSLGERGAETESQCVCEVV